MYISAKEIARRFGVTRQSIWRWAKLRPDFPRPIQLSTGCTRWRLSDIEAWEAMNRA